MQQQIGALVQWWWRSLADPQMAGPGSALRRGWRLRAPRCGVRPSCDTPCATTTAVPSQHVAVELGLRCRDENVHARQPSSRHVA